MVSIYVGNLMAALAVGLVIFIFSMRIWEWIPYRREGK
jgi:hypothetical protein